MCFSLEWLRDLLIWIIVVCGVVALVRLLIAFVLPHLGLTADVLSFVARASVHHHVDGDLYRGGGVHLRVDFLLCAFDAAIALKGPSERGDATGSPSECTNFARECPATASEPANR